jgi:hypothetical protein
VNDSTTLRSKKISEGVSSISAEAEGAATCNNGNDTSVALGDQVVDSRSRCDQVMGALDGCDMHG